MRHALLFCLLALVAGCATTPEAPTPIAPVLTEDEVDVGAVHALFAAAFLETRRLNPSAVLVVKDGVRYQIIVDKDRSLLVYLAHFRFRDDVAQKARLELANRLNTSFIFTRFSVDDDGDLACEYFLSYKGGLTQNRVTDALRWMSETTAGSIRAGDPGHLVQ